MSRFMQPFCCGLEHLDRPQPSGKGRCRNPVGTIGGLAVEAVREERRQRAVTIFWL